ncbi:FtsB family cell division protein [Mycobacterium talmoniae]|uniref:Septation inhibitor protein n=1 Tax=Mycobacterium talmoniae TaxID=1858794 RepID=A0A1S1NHK8_9MYCO|nr:MULTISPECIES: septum formation initiator family protein [Mycobacterium]OHV03041.1 septation inhibitor protein [Mycobacterium talmoniae]TDH50140.1 septum formation initiator family protein [Mycobacterium eburneum]
MPDAKRPDPKRRSPASRPGRPGGSGRGRPRKSPAAPRREPRAQPEPVVEPIRRSITESAELRSEQRLGFTARRAAILAAVICVLTLTIAGPVRTYFAQRTEMKQLAAVDAKLRQQISDLQEQKTKLADPAYIKAKARERLGYVMPGETPYQVQVPPGAAAPAEPGAGPEAAARQGPWYAALWHTIADEPHGPPAAPAPPPNPAQPGG